MVQISRLRPADDRRHRYEATNRFYASNIFFVLEVIRSYIRCYPYQLRIWWLTGEYSRT
jgi:hypothetical protein